MAENNNSRLPKEPSSICNLDAIPRAIQNSSNCDKTGRTAKSARYSDAHPSTSHSGLKKTIPGTLYQVKLLTLFLCRASNKSCNFRVGSEWEEAGKFDDVVYESKVTGGGSMYRFLQAKRISKPITEDKLFRDLEGDFSVKKYFISFRKIIRNPIFKQENIELKDFILCTNVGISNDLECYFVELKTYDELLGPPINNSRRLKFNQLEGRNILLPILRISTECGQLLAKLGECVIKNTKISFRHNELFIKYHGVLINSIINLDEKKFRDTFFNADTKSIELLRNLFLECMGIYTNNVINHSENSRENFQKLTRYVKRMCTKWSCGFSSRFLQDRFANILSKSKLEEIQNYQNSKLQIEKNFKNTLSSNECGTGEILIPPSDVCAELAKSLSVNVLRNQTISIKNKLFNDHYIFLVTYVIDLKLEKFRDSLFDNEALEGLRNNFLYYLNIPENLCTPNNSEETEENVKKIIGCVNLNCDFEYEFTSSFIRNMYTVYSISQDNCNEFSDIKFTIEGKVTKKQLSNCSIDSLLEDVVTEEEINCFIDHFVFAVQQPDEDALSTVIANELTTNSVNNELLCDHLFQKMLNWFKDTNNCFLSDIEFKEVLLNVKAKIELITGKSFNTQYKFVNEALNKIKWTSYKERIVNIINCYSTILTSLKITQLLENKETHGIHGIHIVLNISEVLRLQNYYEIKLISESINFLIIDCEDCEINSIKILCSWLIHILNLKISTQIILLTTTNYTEYVFDDFKKYGYDEIQDEKNNFLSLETHSQKILLKQNIIFFGKSLPMRELITDDLKRVINPYILLQLLKNVNITIGKPHESLGDVSKYYVKQNITQYIGLDRSILDDTANFHIVEDLKNFEAILNAERPTMGKSEFHIPFESNIVSDEGNKRIQYIERQLEKCGKEKDIIFISESEQHFRYLHKRQQNIHWISGKLEDLVWKQTEGSLLKIYRYLNRKSGKTHIVNSINDLKDKLVVISGNAGLGKSTLLTHLLSSYNNRTLWCQKINLVEFSETHLKFWGDKVKETQVKDFLLKAFCLINCPFAKDIFEHYYNNCELVLLIDGYDEISPRYVSQVNCLLNILKMRVNKMVVTTRPYTCQKELYTKLNVVPYTLGSFSMKNETDFLKNYWLQNVKEINHDKFTLFTDKLLKEFSGTTNDSALEFIAVPLHLKMVAEVFADEFNKYYYSDEIHLSGVTRRNINRNLNILFLYERFIKVKYYQKITQQLNYTLEIKFQSSFNECIKKYINLSLMELYNKETLQELLGTKFEKIYKTLQKFRDSDDEAGIMHVIDQGNTRFNHRTYAEYFVALWFSRNIRKEQVKTFIKKHIFETDHLMVNKFLNLLLLRHDVIDDNMDISQDNSEKYLLHNFVLNNDEANVQNILKLENRIDLIKRKDIGGRNALYLAACCGYRTIAKYILIILDTEKQDVIDSKDDICEWSALSYSIRSERWNICELLLEHQADCSEIKYESVLTEKISRVLHLAASKNLFELLKKAIEAGSDVNEDVSGTFALHTASMNGHLQIVQYLCTEGAKISIEDTQHKTALHYAAENGHFRVFEYLFDNCKPFSSNSIVRSAIIGGNIKILLYLLDRGYDCNYIDDEANTGLHIAASSGHFDVVEYLVANMGNVKDVNNQGETILHAAVTSGNINIVDYLLKQCYNNDDMQNVCTKDGIMPLHYAAGYGTLEILKYLVSVGANLDIHDNMGRYSIHWAVLCNQLHIVKYLITRSINCNLVTTIYGLTPLHIAAENGNLEIFKYLLSNGANLGIPNKEGFYSIHYAVHFNHLHLVEYLIAHGVSYDLADTICGMTPLHVAATQGYLNIFKYLVSIGANRDIIDGDGFSSIHHAAQFNKLQIVEYLVCIGTNYNQVTTTHGFTPLHIAAARGNLDICKYLISKGANSDVFDKAGLCSIHYAALLNHLPVIEYFVSCGLNYNQGTTNDGFTLLHIAAREGNLEILKYLVSKGADLDLFDSEGFHCIHHAVQFKHLPVVEYLIAHGVYYDQVSTAERLTPLHIASREGHLEIFKYLVSKGANLDTFDTNGLCCIHQATLFNRISLVNYIAAGFNYNQVTATYGLTPLHIATEKGNLEMIKTLISNEAKLDIFDLAGCHIIHYAVYFNHLDIIDYLITYGVNCNQLTITEGATPLHIAAQKGLLEITKFLVSKGANLYIYDNDGLNALHHAASNNRLSVLKYFLQIGIDPNEPTKIGITPIHVAAHKGYFKIVSCLIDSGAN